MKFTDDMMKEVEIEEENTALEQQFSNMESQTDQSSDQFQASVVNGCSRVLMLLEDNGCLTDYARREQLKESVKALRDFHYTIGFAGGQSSGKSTVVNAMLQYPLMPTCMSATTCIPVELFYSQQIRIVVSDADTKEILLDYFCDQADKKSFEALKNYACAISQLPQVIENLQPFVEKFVGDYENGIEPDQLDMQYDNPKHVAVLLLMLLTVDTKQNLKDLTDKEKKLIALREETLQLFHISKEAANISVRIQWDCPLLKSGLRILDLPGLGANAEDKKLPNGKILKGHDTITKEAIETTDTMVVVQNPEMLASVVKTVEHMVSCLKVKEAVVENCIVPVLNKIDTCKGAAGQQNAFDNFLTMLTNVGVHKKQEDIFPLSAIYGEYAYEECPDYSRTLYCSQDIDKLRLRGADEKKIQRKLESLVEGLQDEYQDSGVEQLREFFRTAFIEKGKIEKTFSTLAEMKSCELDVRSKAEAKKQLYMGFAGANNELVATAVPELRRIANEPIESAIGNIEGKNISEKIKVMVQLSDSIVTEYKVAFQDAAEDYNFRNRTLIDQMKLIWKGVGNYARIDSGVPQNYRLYQEFKHESQKLNVNMSKVNMRYADVLTVIKKDIEAIFDHALSSLQAFSNSYETNIKMTIEQYKGHVNPEIIKIFEEMMPVVVDFVRDQINVANDHINQTSKEIGQAQINIANLIIRKNDEFTRSISDHMTSNIRIKEAGFLSNEKMKIDGKDGAKAALEETKDMICHDPSIELNIRTVCGSEIITPMRSWYGDASASIKDAFVELEDTINTLLDEKAEYIQADRENLEDYIGQLDEKEKQIEGIFCGLKGAIRDMVLTMMPLAYEKKIISKTNQENLKLWLSGGELLGEECV